MHLSRRSILLAQTAARAGLARGLSSAVATPPPPSDPRTDSGVGASSSGGSDGSPEAGPPSRSSAAAASFGNLPGGPGLDHFLRVHDHEQQLGAGNSAAFQGGEAPLAIAAVADPWAAAAWPPAGGRSVYLETYGCQMNISDSEVLLSVLSSAGYERTLDPEAAHVVLLNTCAIREGAEQRIWGRLGRFKALKAERRAAARRAGGGRVKGLGQGPVVGVLGCMAERLKDRLLVKDKSVDIVAGPDAYRDLPRLIEAVLGGEGTAMNVQLSAEETYADITPLREGGARSAFISIMRGCNNLCSFCIVPFTRGRERSRPLDSIVSEVKMLSESGVREVTLLGQNVNSYNDDSLLPRAASPADEAEDPFGAYAEGFQSVYKPRRAGRQFAELLDAVAAVDPEMRIRFTSPHPKDFSDDVIEVIARRQNVCKQLHMPAQSGSSDMLARMKRGYTRGAYDALVARIRDRIPGVALSTDIITGFSGETKEEHEATLDLLRSVQFEQAYMFAYSERGKTHAARHLPDDVPEAVKAAQLQQIIAAFREGLAARYASRAGALELVLVQAASKRDASQLTGRTDRNERVVFPDIPLTAAWTVPHLVAGLRASVSEGASSNFPCEKAQAQAGDYVAVRIERTSPGTLFGAPLVRTRQALWGDMLQEVAKAGADAPGAAGAVPEESHVGDSEEKKGRVRIYEAVLNMSIIKLHDCHGIIDNL